MVWGVTLSADKTYVVSFVKNAENPDNISERVRIALPKRAGYVCDGFSTTESGSDGQVYDPTQIASVPDGTVLYVVWRAQS